MTHTPNEFTADGRVVTNNSNYKINDTVWISFRHNDKLYSGELTVCNVSPDKVQLMHNDHAGRVWVPRRHLYRNEREPWSIDDTDWFVTLWEKVVPQMPAYKLAYLMKVCAPVERGLELVRQKGR